MKVLIVGGAGYVGGFLTDYLCSNNYDVTIYDSLIYENHYLKKVSFIFGDVRDRDKLSRLLPQFDVVIWLAAVVGDGACANDPYLAQAINEDSVKWLVDNYKGKIVFMSTCSVYGINNELIDENAKTNPLSVYARTKLAAEQYIVKNDKDYLIFRLGTLFGLGDQHSRIRLDLVVNILTKKAVLGETLTVFGGDQWRPLLHVKDVSTAIKFGLDNSIKGLYNLCQENYMVKDVAEEIKNILPISVKIEYQDIKYEDQRNYRVKSDGFKSKGWKPQHSLQEGIQEMFLIIKSGRIKDLDNPIYSNEFFMKKNYMPL
jgi:nucleoside-diphosphate-sugar epimerase